MRNLGEMEMELIPRWSTAICVCRPDFLAVKTIDLYVDRGL
jgi:hypothetical protein